MTTSRHRLDLTPIDVYCDNVRSRKDICARDVRRISSRRPLDRQGFLWEKICLQRHVYRSMRTHNKEMKSDDLFFNFTSNSIKINPHIAEFEIRRGICSTDEGAFVIHKTKTIFPNTLPCIVEYPSMKTVDTLGGRLPIFYVKKNIMIVGGSKGLLVKMLNLEDCETLIRRDPIQSSIKIHDEGIFSCVEGCQVYLLDLTGTELLEQKFKFAVKSCSLSPDGKVCLVVGDHPRPVLKLTDGSQAYKELRASEYDEKQRQTASLLCGGWHPNGIHFATGGEDGMCKIWDARKDAEPVHVFSSAAFISNKAAAFSSLDFSHDGRWLAAGEDADFVRIFDVKAGYQKSQHVDYFGSTAGVSFSPDSSSLYIGVCDEQYGSLLVYGR